MEKKKEHPIDYDYHPEDAVPGFFCERGSNVEECFQKKNGALEVMNTIVYLYMQRQYETTMDLVDRYIVEAKKQPRKMKINDVLEIACRCALKTKNNSKALDYVQAFERNREPGPQFLKAQVHTLVGKNKEALKLLFEYLDTRTNDYLAWVMIADNFQQLSLSDIQFHSFEYQALRNALHLVERNKKDNELSKRLEKHEIEPLRQRFSQMASGEYNISLLETLELSEKHIHLFFHFRFPQDKEKSVRDL